MNRSSLLLAAAIVLLLVGQLQRRGFDVIPFVPGRDWSDVTSAAKEWESVIKDEASELTENRKLVKEALLSAADAIEEGGGNPYDTVREKLSEALATYDLLQWSLWRDKLRQAMEAAELKSDRDYAGFLRAVAEALDA